MFCHFQGLLLVW